MNDSGSSDREVAAGFFKHEQTRWHAWILFYIALIAGVLYGRFQLQPGGVSVPPRPDSLAELSWLCWVAASVLSMLMLQSIMALRASTHAWREVLWALERGDLQQVFGAVEEHVSQYQPMRDFLKLHIPFKGPLSVTRQFARLATLMSSCFAGLAWVEWRENVSGWEWFIVFVVTYAAMLGVPLLLIHRGWESAKTKTDSATPDRTQEVDTSAPQSGGVVNLTLAEARQERDKYLQGLSPTHQLRSKWTQTAEAEIQAVQWPGEGWLFLYPEGSAIVVDGRVLATHGVYGAVARGYLPKRLAGWARLGMPRSDERWLGSGRGRYQLFEMGIVTWEADPDLGFPQIVGPDVLQGRRCHAMIAFADIRESTSWAEHEDASVIARAIRELEADLQEVLSRSEFSPIYIKPAGDGMLILSEEGWFQEAAQDSAALESLSIKAEGVSPPHAASFILTCEAFMQRATETLKPYGRKIGCGIDGDLVTQVFACGRRDYLGDPLNQASKLQDKLENKIRVSKRVFDAVKAEETMQRIAELAQVDERGYVFGVGGSNAVNE